MGSVYDYQWNVLPDVRQLKHTWDNFGLENIACL